MLARFLIPSSLPRGGFIRALQLVLRLRVGGLLHAGPPCSSWVWVSRGSTKRTRANPMGCAKLPATAEGNTTLRLNDATSYYIKLIKLASFTYQHEVESDCSGLWRGWPSLCWLQLAGARQWRLSSPGAA